MIKKLFILFKIGRKLSTSGAISSIYEIYNPPTIVKILFFIIGFNFENKKKQTNLTSGIYQVIVTDDNPREELPSKIRQQILLGCPNATEIADRNSAIKFAISKLQDNDLLLIAGKGHESTQTIGTESLPFDDYTVSKEALKNIKKNGIKN